MTDRDWVVLLNTGTDIHVYGPMEAIEAQAFARFMTKEVDPATAFKLRSPLREVLGWHESELARNSCTHGAGCLVHPDVQRPHGMQWATPEDEQLHRRRPLHHNRKQA